MASKFAKSAYIICPNIIFPNISIWVSKSAEFDADLESVKKLGKKLREKFRGLRTFSTVLKDENQKFCHFYVNNFVVKIFSNFFTGFVISVKF